MTIYYIDPSLAVDDTGALGYPFTSGAAYTPTGVAGSRGAGKIYALASDAYTNAGGNTHQFYFRRSFYHDKSSGVFLSAFITKTGLVVDSYGTGALPVLDGFLSYPPGPASDALWTYSGNGLWYIEPAGATSVAYTLRTGMGPISTTSRKIGSFWRRAYSVADIGPTACDTKQSIWFSDTGSPYRITVYTGSSTMAPPSYYNGIQITQNGSGVGTGLINRNGAAYNTFKNIDIWGVNNNGIGCASLTTASVNNISFNNVNLYGCWNVYARFAANGASGYTIKGVSYTNSIVDNLAFGPNSIDNATLFWQKDDPIFVQDLVEGALIYNVSVKTGSIHTALNISSDNDSSPTYLPRSIVMGKVKVEQYLEAVDGRALGVNNAVGVILSGITTINTSAKSQVSGQNVYIVGCNFGPLNVNYTASEQRFLLELTNFPNCISPLNRNVINNTFRTEGPALNKAAIGINTYSTAVTGVPASSLCISNNLAILDPTDAFIARAPYNAAADAAKPISNTQQILNNYVCRSDGSTGLATTANATGTIAADSYVNDQPLNGFMASSGNFGNTLSVAQVNSALVPTSSSPLLRTGVYGIALTDASGLSFTFYSRKDNKGVPYYNPPTIGAYESSYSRTART